MKLPETLEEALAPDWLSEALDGRVTAVLTGPIDNRISTNQPARVTFADGSCRDIWIKGYFSDTGRPFRIAGVPETMFYRELSAQTGIRTLRPLFSDADPTTSANVLITEDVLGHGANFLNALSPYTVDQTAESLQQLATLHASTWMRPQIQISPWLAPRFESYTVSRGVTDIAVNFDGPIGAGVPSSVRDADWLYRSYQLLSASLPKEAPWCVIHGDPHIGNVYLDGAGRPCFVDWQLIQRGPWYLDVGYHLASALAIEDRRANERDLVRCYLGDLTSRGAIPPTEERAWSLLHRGFLHGFYLWAITLKVDPRITSELLSRLGTAVLDHPDPEST